MRGYYRTAALVSASALLFYFDSCERHKPEELDHGGHAAGEATEHSANDVVPHADHAASPQATATPAQFFPSPTP